MIPLLDIGPLFGPDSPERRRVDSSLGDAAETSGFFTIAGPSAPIPTDAENRAVLLAPFGLPLEEQKRLWRRYYAPSHHNVYRGWSPRQPDDAVDIFDLGPDIAHPADSRMYIDDPLLGATPLPPPGVLPGWHGAVARYYRSMERLGMVLMQSVARWLELPESFFDDDFRGGISTLRLMRYQLPPADPSEVETYDPGMPRRGEHVDSGFVTLLCQNGVAGLSAKMRTGEWVDVPPVDGHLVVNFGGVLERWTGGRISATAHRVVSRGSTRYSIPFFYEPRVHAVIRPLPLPGAVEFAPFTYGDHLWAAMSKFPNFSGIADLRTPRGVPI